MFQTFTGNSRRPRQVNLSGRNPNPFASSNPGQAAAAPGSKDALANAQQERLRRQQARDEQNAALVVQRVWRGSRSRGYTKQKWRKLWDEREEYHHDPSDTPGHEMFVKTSDRGPYPSVDECYDQLQLLLQFASPYSHEDVRRLIWYAQRLLADVKKIRFIYRKDQWRLPLLRLERLTLRALELIIPCRFRKMAFAILLKFLDFLSTTILEDTVRNAVQYFGVLASVTSVICGYSYKATTSSLSSSEVEGILLATVLAPLHSPTAERSPGNLDLYQTFVTQYLVTSNLHKSTVILKGLAQGLDYELVEMALADLCHYTSLEHVDSLNGTNGTEKRLWLLAHLIYFSRHRRHTSQSSAQRPEPDFISVVSILLGSVADVVRSWVDEATPSNKHRSLPMSKAMFHEDSRGTMLQPFVRDEILSLIDQQNISSLLSGAGHSSSSHDQDQEAKLLASYALTLLRVFPRRGLDIRTWLLGTAMISTDSGTKSSSRLSAIKFFWNTARTTSVYGATFHDHRSAIQFLKPQIRTSTSTLDDNTTANERDQEWKIMLLFLELYTSVLRVMDDEEFLSGGSTDIVRSSISGSSWTRESALPLGEVKYLTIFLKNLAFTMYWHAKDISASGTTDRNSWIGSFFNPTAPLPNSPNTNSDTKVEEPIIAGVKGMSMDYVKSLVTGLLRMIYERDSRRQFLPKDHWLMTSLFDMEGFIEKVVAEEEDRHKVQEEEDDEPEFQPDAEPHSRLEYRRGHQDQEQMRLKALRKKYLESVTPRLEILQNMPFFIPFETRVRIFREFVYLDQHRRRGGHVDPDQWRMSVMHRPGPGGNESLGRHHAKIRRGNVFEDAYEQFYQLGEGLKEPIQITFVDQFDTVEAGIDGGGVTKEFLTSVTSEAFDPSSSLNLFVENDQHLLYPNPTAIDATKDLLQQAGMERNSFGWRNQFRELLRRYEFLGRVIGKCLYEGILVDVGFAGFFLLKWALTGGSGSGSKESGYRANLNDLRDFDEELYQGLLKLKNYPGDVEQDFGLNFTVSDTISPPPRAPNSKNPHHTPHTVTRDLQPGGSEIPVTNKNRIVYIQYIARHRLSDQPREQTASFLRGLGSVIQPSWLSMFNQSELQTLISGTSSSIDIQDLRRHTLYGGVYALGDDDIEHPSIQLFWNVMTSLTNEEKGKVLKFVTSTPRAPLLGFAMLNPRFSIRDAGADQTRLPSTSTCVNLLKLPRYSDLGTLREKLLYAVNSGAGFDLS
ncbi:MAG: hypothetical protein M1812_005213 [Candelaria pacifica]|nr:MAG: hypothetical protein M1812_005213 [Candelaria pacifica]